MKLDERTVTRLACYGAYVLGVVGLAASLGGWAAWLVVLAAGAVPGAFLLYRTVERVGIEREIEKHRPAPYQQPPTRAYDGAAQAPEPLTPPSSPF